MNVYDFLKKNSSSYIGRHLISPLSLLNMHLLSSMFVCRFLSCEYFAIMPMCDNNLLSQFQIRNCCDSIEHESPVT